MNIMLDLETMGTRPSAPIIAIGAVEFDQYGIKSEFYRNVNLKSAVQDGAAVIDSDTVMWWMQQGDEARGALRTERGGILASLYEFREWLKPNSVSGMWGNGASLDNVVLAESYRRLNLDPPWAFWTDRCYRTVKNMFPDVELERSGTHHNALDDARTQAEHLIAINAKHGNIL